MKRLPVLIAALLGAAVLLSACSTSGGNAAKVDSTAITRSALEDDLRALADNAALVKEAKAQGLNLKPTKGGFDNQLAARWLNSLLAQVIVDREFAKRHLKLTPRITRQAKTGIAANFGTPKTFDAFSKSFRSRLIGRQARRDALIASLGAAKAATDAELRQFYDQNKALLCPTGKLVAHILVKTLEEATAVEQRLAQGADFAQLAPQLSTDTGSAPQGGTLTCVGSSEWQQFDQTFRTGAEAVAIGGVSAPVHTQFGYHVIKVTDYTFENARATIKQALAQQQQDPLTALVERQLRRAKLWVDPRYGKISRTKQGVAIVPPTPRAPREQPSTSTTTGAGTGQPQTGG